MASQDPVSANIRRGLVGLAGFFLCAGLLSVPAQPGLTRNERERVLARIDSLWTAGAYDSAQAAIAPLMTLAQAQDDSLLRLGLLVRDGVHRVSFGDALGAEPLLREALGLAEALGDTTELCPALRWLGLAVAGRGRGTEAVGYYERLLRLATSFADTTHMGWAQIGLAWETRQAGQLDRSARHYQAAAALFERNGDTEGAIWALNGWALTLTSRGDYEAAADCLRDAIKAAERVGFELMRAAALNNLGRLEYDLGDPGAAEGLFRRAYELQRALGHTREALTPATNIALCQIDLGRFAEADTFLAVCLRECEELGYDDVMGQVLSRLAVSCRKQGLLAEAAGQCRRALTRGDEPSISVRMTCLLELAFSLAGMDSIEAAVSVLRASARRMADIPHHELRLRTDLGLGQILLAAERYEEALEILSRVASDAERHGFRTQQLAALVGAARCYRASGEPEKALPLLHQAKEVWEAERGLPLDPEWREQRGGLVKQLYTELGWNLLTHGLASCADRVRLAFDTLQTFKARTLQERMRGPGRDAGSRAELLATLSALQDSVLQRGEILLDAYLGPELSLLFAVTPDTCAAVRLPPEEDLNRILRAFYDVLSSPPEDGRDSAYGEGVTGLGRNVVHLALGDVRSLLESSRRILLVPDGALNLLPLSALLRLSAEDGSPAAQAYTRVPSASILLSLRNRGRTPAPSRGARVLAVAGGRSPEGGELKGAIREAQAIGRAFQQADVRLLPTAADTADSDAFATYDVLHFAAHTAVNDQNPWQSVIQLGRGRLRAAEIAAMELPVTLVVLASCQSAAGRVLSGEGVLGLSSAFLSAGSPAVVATLWPVDDLATAEFMEAFYAGLAEREDAASALRRAQDHLRAEPTTEHPFFWAGFILVGDGDVHVPLEPRRGRDRLFLMTLLGVVVVTVLISHLRRRRPAGRRHSGGPLAT